MELVALRTEQALSLNLQWAEKQATRLPEALWCSFHPIISDPQGWSFSKLGTTITPLEVVSRGNRTLHAVDQDIVYEGVEGKFTLETLDAPLIALLLSELPPRDVDRELESARHLVEHPEEKSTLPEKNQSTPGTFMLR
jgi:hypothetical protein